MKLLKETEWLKFVEVGTKPKTIVVAVLSKCSDDFELGVIQWHRPWRHYCFFPAVGETTIHSDRCLIEIANFITGLNKMHKKGREFIF